MKEFFLNTRTLKILLFSLLILFLVPNAIFYFQEQPKGSVSIEGDGCNCGKTKFDFEEPPCLERNHNFSMTGLKMMIVNMNPLWGEEKENEIKVYLHSNLSNWYDYSDYFKEYCRKKKEIAEKHSEIQMEKARTNASFEVKNVEGEDLSLYIKMWPSTSHKIDELTGNNFFELAKEEFADFNVPNNASSAYCNAYEWLYTVYYFEITDKNMLFVYKGTRAQDNNSRIQYDKVGNYHL